MQKRTMLFVVALAVASLSLACGGLSSQQKTAASEAIAALRKIEAGTQVGVRYQEFGSLVIDAKAKVNAAAAVLPEGELKNELNAAMDAYADANTAWGVVMQRGILTGDSEPGRTLAAKYGFTFGSGPDAAWTQYQEGLARGRGETSPQRTEVLTKLNSVAKDHLDRASKLLGQ